MEKAIPELKKRCDAAAQHKAENDGKRHGHRLFRAGRSCRQTRFGDDAGLGDRQRLLLGCFFEAAEVGLVECAQSGCPLLQLTQLHHSDIGLRIAARHAVDIVAKRLHTGIGDVVFVLQAARNLLQFLEYLPCNFFLLTLQRYRLRVVGAELLDDALQSVRDRDVALAKVLNDRVIGIPCGNDCIVNRCIRSPVDDGFVLAITCSSRRDIRLRGNQLAVEIGQLAFRHQLAARRNDIIVRLEFFDGKLGGLCTLVQVAHALLKPHGSALAGVEIGVQLFGQIGLRIGLGDERGKLPIRRTGGNGDDRTAADTLYDQRLLQHGGCLFAASGADCRFGGRRISGQDEIDDTAHGGFHEIDRRQRRIDYGVVLVELGLVDHGQRHFLGFQNFHGTGDTVVDDLGSRYRRFLFRVTGKAFIQKHLSHRGVNGGCKHQIKAGQNHSGDDRGGNDIGAAHHGCPEAIEVNKCVGILAGIRKTDAGFKGLVVHGPTL